MPDHDPQPHSDVELQARIMRLEEAEAFSQRMVEQLSGELAELNRRMASALARLDRLEQRLEACQSPSLDPDAPQESVDAQAPDSPEP